MNVLLTNIGVRVRVMRDQAWLDIFLDRTWWKYFAEVERSNTIVLRFGRKARTRLGSISTRPGQAHESIITLNGLFGDPAIPEFVLEATLVHELCHYAHGFNSPLPQKFQHPHRGGIMRREFAERGAETLYEQQKSWLKHHWAGVVSSNFRPRSRRVRRAASVPTPFWFLR